MNVVEILIALSLGGLVGYVLQRGRGCTNTAFRNLTLMGNYELFLMVVVTVCVEMIGYYILSTELFGNQFSNSPLPFSYVLTPLGGFIFGLGTVFAGGCAGGVCYRIGEGSISSLIALLGFSFGIAIFAVGPLADPFSDFQNATDVTYNNQTPVLSQFFPRVVWTLFAGIVLIFTIYYYRNQQRNDNIKLTHLLPNWNPIITGIILGVLGTVTRYFSTQAGRSFGLSTTDGIAQIVQTITFQGPLDWAGFLIVGLILGSFIGASLGREFKISIPQSKDVFRFFGGGVMLGSGAMLATGCNFGHIFGGIPELGISSIFALIFMIIGNWMGSNYYYIKTGHDLPKSTPLLI